MISVSQTTLVRPEIKLNPFEIAFNMDTRKLQIIDDCGQILEIPEAVARFEEVVKENKRLQSALERIRDCDFMVYDKIKAIAREALK